MFLTHLSCSACNTEHSSRELQTVCRLCNKPLYAIYDLEAAGKTFTKESLRGRGKSLWRYREVLPVRAAVNIISLGEGGTPLLDTPRLAARAGVKQLWIKDEAQNPTVSFKARGMAVAVSM